MMSPSRRQVLAEPDATLSDNTWATLADGTPLVTAARRGKGLIVLFHVTGDTRWSDLPLSGAFVEMLRRIVALAGTTSVTDAAKAQTKTAHEIVPPSRVLDGFGNFIAPPPTARPVPSDYSGKRHRRSSAGLLRPARRSRSPSIRWRPPTAWRRSISRRSPMRAVKSTASASRRICAGRSCSPRWRCSCSTPWWCFCSAAAFSGLLPRFSRATAASSDSASRFSR